MLVVDLRITKSVGGRIRNTKEEVIERDTSIAGVRVNDAGERVKWRLNLWPTPNSWEIGEDEEDLRI